jgi:hypothetical protein
VSSDAHQRLRKQIQSPAQHNELAAHPADRCTVVLAEVGDCLGLLEVTLVIAAHAVLVRQGEEEGEVRPGDMDQSVGENDLAIVHPTARMVAVQMGQQHVVDLVGAVAPAALRLASI